MNKREGIYALSGFLLASCVSQKYTVPAGYVDYAYPPAQEQQISSSPEQGIPVH